LGDFPAGKGMAGKPLFALVLYVARTRWQSPARHVRKISGKKPALREAFMV